MNARLLAVLLGAAFLLGALVDSGPLTGGLAILAVLTFTLAALREPSPSQPSPEPVLAAMEDRS